ncbi:class I SAM-dependent methyltransferase [Alteromonas oceanisediminis]|uniref:class I SAM-dependent methyltransferase n=1 Tax=Alteromonas oceanisediminis TaxID=2836180 RepID=UPI001BD962F8|nr:methyltransferase [Alteromonas oceanisediminis]MBT0586541.1 methyltransferase [Alteromonas oceanisediminis]
MNKQALIFAGLLLMSSGIAAQTLEQVVNQRPPEMQQRDAHRHPIQTLEFFRVEPGMTVAEALPGGGWYTQIIAPTLGKNGMIYGINYNDDMWARFGFFSPDAIIQQQALTKQFEQNVADLGDTMPPARGFTFETVPESLKGTADRVLFIRALHNLHRFEADAGTLTQALKVAHILLKPNGLAGVVQHRAPEKSSDAWADGSAGYLKTSRVIEAFKQAGFALIDASEVNANAKDTPNEQDIVWRLPPSYFGSDSDDKKAAMQAIGESDRMTLLFAKTP